MAYTGKKIETKLYDVFTREEAIQNSTPAAVSDKTNTSTGYFDLPAGTTAERPVSATTGMLRFNTDLDQLEQYTSESGWQGISAPPTITTTDVTSVDESDSSQVIVITGQNFDATSSGSLVDANGITKNPTTSVRNSSSQITITYSGGDVLTSSVAEPLDVKVTNGSGLSAVLENQINIDASPVWSTNSGTLTTVSDISTGTHATLSATDPEGQSVSYTVASGALPGGLSLNSSTGVISGDPDNVTGSTTSNFTVDASDGTGNIVNRSFNIIVTPALDGTSSARAATSAINIVSVTGTSTNGMYWLNLDGTPREFYCDMANGGWILFSQYNDNGSSTSYAASQGGYAGAPTSAIATPGSSNDLYGNYGSLYGNLSSGSPWSMNGPMQNWNDSEMGHVWSRQDGNSNGAMRYYRPNNYGYNWSSIKWGMKIATSGSLDGWRNVPSYTGADQPSCEGVQIFHGNTSQRASNHIFSYALANAGGGGAHQGSVPPYIASSSDYVERTDANNGDAYNYPEVSRTIGSATTIPPEIRIGTDQDARVNGAGNENAGLRAWYIFLK
jgi:hypothetical protein